MLFGKKNTIILIAGFLCIVGFFLLTNLRTPYAYAACNADLQTTYVGLPDKLLLGKTFTFDIVVTNIGVKGYAPFVDIIFPSGMDEDDGIRFISADIQSFSLPPIIETIAPEETGVDHPLLVDVSGTPIEIALSTGEQFTSFELPFGSFVPNQTTTITITAVLHEFADVNQLLDIQIRGGFALGCDPLNNYSTDIPVVADNRHIGQIEPVVFALTKRLSGSAGDYIHAVIGPYHVQEYVISVDVGTGQVFSGLLVNDYLPSNMVYQGISSISPAGYQLISEPVQDGLPHDDPNNLLSVYFPVLTGGDAPNDIEVRFLYYTNETSTTGAYSILSGVSTTTTNTVQVSAERTPTDPRDPLGIVVAEDDHTMIHNVMTLKKNSVIFVSGGGFPGGVVEYPLIFDLSDYHQTSGLILEDILGDGLRFDETFQPLIEIVDSEGSYTGFLLSGVHYTIDNSDIGNDTDPATSGSQKMTINISQFMIDAGYDALLQGGEIAQTNGPAAGGRVVIRAIIQDTFTDSYLPGNNSVDVGDYLTNQATLYRDTISLSGEVITSGHFSQSLSFRIQGSSLSKSIYAINGLTGFSSPIQVGPGDVVTYRIVYSMPSSDAEQIELIDYLPLPIFSLSGFQGFSGSLQGTIPPEGRLTYGPTDTFHTLNDLYLYPGTGSVTPTVSTNTTDNTLTILYPAFNDTQNRASVIDLLFSVEVTPEPFADNFFITNMVTAAHDTTNGGSTSISELVQIVLKQPNLSLTKGIIDTTDLDAVYLPAPSSPVVPTDVCPRVGTTITSSLLQATPINSNLQGVEGLQRVTYALVIENEGGAQKGAYDIAFRDTMPFGFTIPTSGLNLCIQNGRGDILDFEAVIGTGAMDTDLFGSGLKIIDPVVGSGVGAIGAYSSTGGDNIIIVTYDLETENTLSASGSSINTGVLFGFSSIEGGPNFVAELVVDTAMLTTVPPTITKELLSTSVADTTDTNVVAGEEATFMLSIAIPEYSTLSGMMVSDSLPAGLELLQIDAVELSGALQLATGYTLTGIIADAEYSPSSGGFTLDFGMLVNTDIDLGTTEYIRITYTVRVSNENIGPTNTVLLNTGSLSWYVDEALMSMTDTVSLLYRIPSLLLDKSGTTSNSSSERFATYTLLVQNTSLAPAYDVSVIDELQSIGLEFISGSLSVLGVVGVVNEAGPDLHVTYDRLLPGEFSELTFQTKVMTGIAYNTNITNIFTGTWSSLSGSSPEEGTYSGSDSLLTSFTFAPTLSKTMISTDQSITTNTNVAVGETMVFRVVVTVPEESPLSGFSITDQLDNGLKFVSVDLLQASGTVMSSLGAISTGVIVPTISSNDTLLTLNFGTLYNSDADLGTNETIILEYTVLVDDAPVNVNGLTRRNRARANWYTSPSTQSHVEQRRSVVVREPLLSVQKTAPATNTDSDRLVTYTIQISNQSANVLTASNLSITDLLPSDMNFISGAQLSGPVPDTLDFGSSSLIEYALFPLGQTGIFEITARLDSSITANTSRTNRATGSRTSLPGVVSGARTTISADDATTNFTFALVPNKYLLDSDYDQTIGTQVTVGEVLMYQIAIEVPEDTAFSDVIVVDQLDEGLSWVGLGGISASGSISSSVGFGSVTPTISGQQIIFDFGNLANSDLDTTQVEYIIIDYSVEVDNIPTNVSSTNLDNTVQTVWIGGSQTVGGPTVTIVEPAVTILKTGPVTNNGQARTVDYVVTISNTSLLDVYDVSRQDIFSGSDMVLLDAFVLSGTTPSSFITGTDVLVSYDVLSGGASSVIGITARLQDSVLTPVSIINTVDASRSNLLTGGRIYTGSDQLQTTFSTLPVLYHEVIATDQPHTVGTGIGVIGELITYQTRIAIPDDAVVHESVLHELLGTGYSFVDGSLSISGDVGISCLPIACENVGIITGTQVFTLDFGTITNVDTDAGVDQYITITYQVLIADIPSVIAGSQLPTTATLQRSDNPTGVSQAVAVTVVEPSVDIDKSGPMTNTNSAREIFYTLTIHNDGIIDAYSLSGHDDLGAIGLDLLSVSHTSGPAPVLTPVGNSFTYSFDTFPVGATTTLSIHARLQDSIPTAYTAINTAPLSRASLPAGLGRVSSDEDSVATSFNTVGAVTKEVIASSEPSTMLGDIAFGETVTYRVQFEVPTDSVYHTVSFNDLLGTGLSYVAGSSVITVSGSVVCDPACSSVTPNIVGNELMYPYTTIANTATGAGMDGLITIEYQAILLDAVGLSDGSITTNSIRILHSDVPGGTLPVSVPFSVVEPDIGLIVSGPVMNTNGARTVTYTIDITNNSDAPAYNLNFSDILTGVGLEFISASHVGGIAPASLGSGDPFVVTYTSLLPGASSELEVTVRLRDDIPTPATITHTMTGTWSSDLQNIRTYQTVDDASTLFVTPYLVSKVLSDSSLVTTVSPHVAIGEYVTYTIQVDMEADSTLNNVSIIDTLPMGMNFISGGVDPDMGVVCTPTCGSAAFVSSGQQVVVNFTTLANPTFTPVQIDIELVAQVADIPEVMNGNSLINTVSLVSSDNTGGVIANAPTLTVVEPQIRLTKDVSNTTGSRTALYQITVDHLPSSAADAYNVSLADPLFDLGFSYVSGSFAVVSGAVPTSSVSTATGISRTYAHLPITESSTVQFLAKLDPSIGTAYAKTNILSGEWTSVPHSGARISEGSDDATITLTSPATLQHIFVDTDRPETVARDVAIGEIATYSVVITVPDDGALTDALLTLSLENGLVFTEISSVSFAPSVTSTLGGAGAIGYTLSGNDVIIDLGTLINSDQDLLSTESITITYGVRVVDIPSNTAGVDLSVLAILDRSDGQIDVMSPDIDIIEAELIIQKDAPLANSEGSRTIVYDVIVSHGTGSSFDAYDVVFEDDLAVLGMQYVTGSLVVSGSHPVIISTDPLILGRDHIFSGEIVSFSFSARLHDSVATPVTVSNIGSVSRTSLSGSSLHERGASSYLVTDQADTDFSSVGSQLKELLTTTFVDTVDPYVTIGEEIVYRLAVEIPKDGALNNLVIVDTLPEEVSYLSSEGVSASSSVSSSAGLLSTLTPIYAPGPHTLTWNLGTVANSSVVSGSVEYIYMAYRVLVDDKVGVEDGSIIENTASAVWSDGSLSGISLSLEVIEPALLFTKTAQDTHFDDQHRLTYQVVVEHAPGSRSHAYEVVLVDDLAGGMLTSGPASVSVVSGVVPTLVTLSGSDLVVMYDSLALGSGSILEIITTVDPSINTDQIVTNTLSGVRQSLPDAHGSGRNASSDPAVAYRQHSQETIALDFIDLSLSSSLSVQTITPNQSILYTLTLANTGMTTAHDIEILTTLPTGSGIDLVSYHADIGVYNQINGIWEVNSLLPGESVSLTLEVTSQLANIYTLYSEIIAAREPDRDSYPNNQLLNEDDMTREVLVFANSGKSSSVPGSTLGGTTSGGGQTPPVIVSPPVSSYDTLINIPGKEDNNESLVDEPISTVLDDSGERVLPEERNMCIGTFATCPYNDGRFDVYEFFDVTPNDTFSFGVQALVNHCVIHGNGDSAEGDQEPLFAPYRDMTWGEAIKMIARSLKMPADEIGDHFVRKQIDTHWALPYAKSLQVRGILREEPPLDQIISQRDFFVLLVRGLQRWTLVDKDIDIARVVPLGRYMQPIKRAYAARLLGIVLEKIDTVSEDQVGIFLCEERLENNNCAYTDGRFSSYQFADIQGDILLQQSIATLVSSCIIHGVGDSAEMSAQGLYRPSAHLLHGEAYKMIARVFGLPEVGDHFLLKQDIHHRAYGYETSLLLHGTLTSRVDDLDAPIRYVDFMRLLGRSDGVGDTLYEFDRGDAAKILANYLIAQ